MKLTATVHQLQLTRVECDVLNQIGRAAAHKTNRKFFAYDEIKMDDSFKPDFWQYYTKQGTVEVDTDDARTTEILLDEIFAGGNDDGYGRLGEIYNRYRTAYSISVGDIIKLGEQAYLVAGCGFEPVELLEVRNPCPDCGQDDCDCND